MKARLIASLVIAMSIAAWLASAAAAGYRPK